MISGGSVNTYTSHLVTELLRDGDVTRLVRDIRLENKAKMEALLQILRDELPQGCTIWHEPTGGYFLYILLPEALKSKNVVKTLMDEHQLMVHSGMGSYSGSDNDFDGKKLANGIRLAIAYPLIDEVMEAARILCQTLHEMLQKAKQA